MDIPEPARFTLRIATVSFVLLASLLPAIVVGEGDLRIRYELDLEFTPQSESNPATIGGINWIQVHNHWQAPIDTLYLHTCNAHYDPDDATTPHTVVSGVTGPGEIATSDDGLATVPVVLESPLMPGDSIRLGLEFETRIATQGNPFAPTLGTRGDTTIYTLIFFYPILEYFFPDGWHHDEHGGAADPHANLADYRTRIVYPDGFVLGTSASPGAQDTLDDGRLAARGTSPRSASFSASLSAQFEYLKSQIHGIDFHFLFPPGERRHVDSLIAAIEGMIPFLESWFGPCPGTYYLVTLSYSLSDAAGAVATTNFIVYQGDMGGTTTFSHEFCHMWFGDALLANENLDAWLNEGFSEFGSRLWSMHRKERNRKPLPATRGFNLWKDLKGFRPEHLYWLFPDVLGEGALKPLHISSRDFDWEELDDIPGMISDVYMIYYHGSNLLQALQSSLGDDVMRGVMGRYTERYYDMTVTLDSFTVVLQEVAGEQIATAFHGAVMTTERPDYAISRVSRRQNGPDSAVTTFEVSATGPWVLPVVYRARGADGTLLSEGKWSPYDSSNVTLKTPDPVTSISLDPDYRSMDRFRFNNHWPRRFDIQPLYGLPGRDGYRLFLSPEHLVDEQGQARIGLSLAGGLGLDAMPLSPSHFRHALKLDLTWGRKAGDAGLAFRYRNPLWSSYRHILQLDFVLRQDFNAQAVSFINYFGPMTWYLAGGQSRYQQLKSSFGRVFDDPVNETSLVWSESLTLFHQTMAMRRFVDFSFSLGQLHNGSGSDQLIASAALHGNLDAQVFSVVGGGLHAGVWLADDPSTSGVLSFRSGLLPATWDRRTGALPFRGFSQDDDSLHQTALTAGFTLALGSSSRFRFRPQIYADALLTEHGGGSIDNRLSSLESHPVYAAVGLGFESRWALDLGVYLPLWLSHPPAGQEQWRFRAMLRVDKHW